MTDTTCSNPTELTNAHLEAIAPHIASVKVDTPDVWEAAYSAAADPTDVPAAQAFSATNPAALTPEELAAEMKKVKFLWGELGMYALQHFVDPNPCVKAQMASDMSAPTQ